MAEAGDERLQELRARVQVLEVEMRVLREYLEDLERRFSETVRSLYGEPS